MDNPRCMYTAQGSFVCDKNSTEAQPQVRPSVNQQQQKILEHFRRSTSTRMLAGQAVANTTQ